MRLKAHEQFLKKDSSWGFVELVSDFELALLNNAEELAGLLERYLSLVTAISSRAGITLTFCPSFILAIPLAFAGCVGRSGGANTRLLRVMLLSPVILVTLADSELMSVAPSFLSLGGVYLHGTMWLFLYGNEIGLTTKGCRGV